MLKNPKIELWNFEHDGTRILQRFKIWDFQIPKKNVNMRSNISVINKGANVQQFVKIRNIPKI